MNRRTYLGAAGGAIASLVGAAAASATRADVVADASLVRGGGTPITTRGTVTRDSIEYVAATDGVRYGGTTEPFVAWARRECAAVGSTAVLPAIDDRIDGPLDGVGTGVRSLAFGLVVTVDHTVVRDRDGSVTGRPSVGFEELVTVAPRSVTATVVLEGREYTRDVPVVVRRGETQSL